MYIIYRGKSELGNLFVVTEELYLIFLAQWDLIVDTGAAHGILQHIWNMERCFNSDRYFNRQNIWRVHQES